jgi:transcription elongation factor GreA
MFDKPVYVTSQGKVELEKEIAYLQDIKSPEIIDRLQNARGGGDWMDNTEHMLVEEQLAFVNGRIQELTYMITHAQIIEPGNEDNIIDIGETIVIQSDEGELEEYTIVGVAESDPAHGLISNESPLGAALLHHKVGDEIIVHAPAGNIHYCILAVT